MTVGINDFSIERFSSEIKIILAYDRTADIRNTSIARKLQKSGF
jgi:hypothetical protein